MKFPHKKEICTPILKKTYLTEFDVLELNKIIFGDSLSKNKLSNNTRYRSYDTSTILKILDYQKANNLSNVRVAKHFGLSRNTIAKWKKRFI